MTDKIVIIVSILSIMGSIFCHLHVFPRFKVGLPKKGFVDSIAENWEGWGVCWLGGWLDGWVDG